MMIRYIDQENEIWLVPPSQICKTLVWFAPKEGRVRATVTLVDGHTLFLGQIPRGDTVDELGTIVKIAQQGHTLADCVMAIGEVQANTDMSFPREYLVREPGPQDLEAGRAAFLAYGDAMGWTTVDGQRIPSWDVLRDDVRLGWVNSASGVMKRHREKLTAHHEALSAEQPDPAEQFAAAAVSFFREHDPAFIGEAPQPQGDPAPEPAQETPQEGAQRPKLPVFDLGPTPAPPERVAGWQPTGYEDYDPEQDGHPA